MALTSKEIEQFWICIIVSSSLSVIGIVAIIVLFLLDKKKNQRSRFVLNIAIYDGLFSLSCLIVCVVNYADDKVLLNNHCLQAPGFSVYEFVWFFYICSVCWIVTLAFHTWRIVTKRKTDPIQIRYEIALHVGIVVVAFMITWVPIMFDNKFYVSNGAMCMWGPPDYLTGVFVPFAVILLLFWGWNLVSLRRMHQQTIHPKTQETVSSAHKKTIAFMVIFLVCNIPKYIAIHRVAGFWLTAIAIFLLHGQGLFNGFAYGWNVIEKYIKPKESKSTTNTQNTMITTSSTSTTSEITAEVFTT